MRGWVYPNYRVLLLSVYCTALYIMVGIYSYSTQQLSYALKSTLWQLYWCGSYSKPISGIFSCTIIITVQTDACIYTFPVQNALVAYILQNQTSYSRNEGHLELRRTLILLCKQSIIMLPINYIIMLNKEMFVHINLFWSCTQFSKMYTGSTLNNTFAVPFVGTLSQIHKA